jgi:molybdopterin synthase sulfur carrier subunit
MKVKVLFHSYFRELAGRNELLIEIPEGSTLGDLIGRVYEVAPKIRPLERSMLKAVGVEYQDVNYRLREGDEVSLFPPVQGG